MADLAVVLMEEGLAQILLVGRSIKSTDPIQACLPRKKNGGRGSANSGHDSALKKFFDDVLQALLNRVDIKVVRCVVIAGPGCTKDEFRRHLMLEASKIPQLRTLIGKNSQIVVAHAPSAQKQFLKDVLNDPDVRKTISDTKAAKEVRALNDFSDVFLNDSTRACYGTDEVELANDQMAIKTLLITDKLLF